MPKKSQVKPVRLSSLSIAVILLMFAAVIATSIGYVLGVSYKPGQVLGMGSLRAAKPENPGKSNKIKTTAPGQLKKNTPSEEVDLTTETVNTKKAKPTKAPRAPKGLNGTEYKKNVGRAVTELNEVAEDVETNEFDEETSAEIEEAVSEVEEDLEPGETADAIDSVEGRPKWQTVLVGTDYKNLGKLRSSMVKNRNAIRALERAQTKVKSEEAQLSLQRNIATLEQEQERVGSIIEENEEQFSVLGWAFRFLSGYTPVEDDTDEGIEDDTDVGDTSPETDLNTGDTSPDNGLDAGDTSPDTDSAF